MDADKSKDILKMAKKAGLIGKPSAILKRSLSESGIKNNVSGSVSYVLSRLFWMLSEHCFKVKNEEN